MRVMIVDEDVELSELLKLSLHVGFYEKAKRLARQGQALQEGLEIKIFSDPEQALSHLAQHAEAWDVIFSDWTHPKPEGLAFVATCQKRFRDQYGELIVVTDRENQKEAETGLQAGANGYLFKPFAPEQLVACMWKAGQLPAVDGANAINGLG